LLEDVLDLLTGNLKDASEKIKDVFWPCPHLAGPVTQFWVTGSRSPWRYPATHARDDTEQMGARVRAGVRRRGQRAQQRAAPRAEP